MNLVMLTGRLAGDPHAAYGANSQTAYCSFSIAVQRADGKNGDAAAPDFIRAVAFGRTAENMEKYLEKGCRICLEGELHADKFEKDGQQRYKTTVVARRVEFLDFKKNGEPSAEDKARLSAGVPEDEEEL